MYLEAELVTDQAPAPVTEAAPTNGNGSTKQRLSTIELIMMAGVTISAVSLAINVWNLTRKAASSS